MNDPLEKQMEEAMREIKEILDRRLGPPVRLGMNYQDDALRTVSKWLNEGTEHVPRVEIAKLCAALLCANWSRR